MTVRIESPDGDTIEMISPEQSYSPEVTVTDVNVERAKDVSDHAQSELREFSVRGVFSEHPIDVNDADVTTLPIEARDFFQKIEGEVVTVTTSRLGRFPVCVMTEYPHAVDDRQRLEFQIGFKQIRIAQFQTVDIPPQGPAPDSRAGAPDSQEVGRQPKTQRSATKSQTDASEAATLQGIGG